MSFSIEENLIFSTVWEHFFSRFSHISFRRWARYDYSKKKWYCSKKINSFILNSLILNSLILNSLILNSLILNSLILNSLILNSLILNSLILNSLILNSLILNSLQSRRHRMSFSITRLLNSFILNSFILNSFILNLIISSRWTKAKNRSDDEYSRTRNWRRWSSILINYIDVRTSSIFSYFISRQWIFIRRLFHLSHLFRLSHFFHSFSHL